MSYDPRNQPVRAAPPPAEYEVIDVDPYFGRVVSYFRGSDYGIWASSAIAFPLSLQVWERFEPNQGAFKAPSKLPGGILRAATLMGFLGGFYFAYVRSSKRFLGWSENAREVKRDRYEMKKLLSEGKLPFHENESSLDDRMKDIANRNSQYSFLTMAFIPWFNLAYHPYHGINIQKYYENRPGEESWGFELKPFEEIKSKYTKILN